MADTLGQSNQNDKPTVPFLTKLIATGFYSGYSPIAPGTAGSFVGLLFFLIPGFGNSISLSISILIAFFAGVITSNQMKKLFGDDPSQIVIDEIVGMWISILFLPQKWMTLLIAFIFFRLFDIVKPQPARFMEKFQHGWGIMLDDVVAGIYANLSVQLLIWFFPSLTI